MRRTEIAHDEVDAAMLLAAVPEAVLVVRGDVVVAASDEATSTIGADPVGRAIGSLLARWAPTSDGDATRAGELLPDHGDPIAVEVRTNAVAEDLRVISLRVAGADALADDAVREAEAKYRTLVEQIPAIVYIDVEGRGTAPTSVRRSKRS